MMKKVKGYALLAAVVVGAGVAVYAFGLTDEARSSLKGAARNVGASYKRLSNFVSDMRGVVVEDDTYLPNREDALRQWEALGY